MFSPDSTCDDNEASAYVSGYLASLYLSKLALEYSTNEYQEESHEKLVIETEVPISNDRDNSFEAEEQAK